VQEGLGAVACGIARRAVELDHLLWINTTQACHLGLMNVNQHVDGLPLPGSWHGGRPLRPTRLAHLKPLPGLDCILYPRLKPL
jgi:hypothetical protein